MDAVAQETVLASLKTTLAGRARLAAELRELSATAERPVRLAQFLETTGRELDEVYGKKHGWAGIRADAGVANDVDDATADLSRRLGWLAHVDEPTRLRAYQAAVAGGALSASDRTRVHMLEFLLNHRGVLRAAEDTVAYLTANPATVAELDELSEVLSERIPLPDESIGRMMCRFGR